MLQNFLVFTTCIHGIEKSIDSHHAQPHPGAPATASQNGAFCAGLPAGAALEPGETLRDAPTKDFNNTLPKGDSLEDLRRTSPELFWTDAQPRDSQDVAPPADLDETPTPTLPGVPAELSAASAAAPAESVRSPSPTPTVAEFYTPESPTSPGSPRGKRGKSPTYFKFLGTGMTKM